MTYFAALLIKAIYYFVTGAPLCSSLFLSSSNVLNTVGDPGIAEKEDADSVFMEMICPSGTNPDDSPLYVLCCNDTCSFTWTGAEHINQVSPRGHSYTIIYSKCLCGFKRSTVLDFVHYVHVCIEGWD